MKYFLKAIVWTIMVLYLSLSPAETFPKVGVLNIDKLVHVFIYFILTFLYLAALYKNKVRPTKYYSISGIIGIVLGAGLELLQGGIEAIHRSADWLDMLANCLGVVMAMGIFKSIIKWFEKHSLTRWI